MLDSGLKYRLKKKETLSDNKRKLLDLKKGCHYMIEKEKEINRFWNIWLKNFLFFLRFLLVPKSLTII